MSPGRAPVARALGLQNRQIWQVTTGSLSDQVEPTRPMHTPQMPFFHSSPLCVAVFEVPQQPSNTRQPRYNNRASSFSLCDSHERCVCMCVRERACVCTCAIVGSYSSRNQEHILKNTSAIQLLLLFFIFAMLLAAAAVCPYHTASI